MLIMLTASSGVYAASRLPVYKIDNVIYFFDKQSGTITGFAGSPVNVTIPSELGGYAVKSIGGRAFAGASTLVSAVIPEGIIYIGESAFSGCVNLKSIIVAASVEYIGKSAFGGCSSLSDVKFSGPVSDIEDNAFYGTAYISGSGAEFVILGGTKLIKYCGTNETVYVPSGVESVAENAFAYNSTVKSIILPEGLRSIGHNAFLQCNSLEDIYIPQTVSSVGAGAFDDTKWIRNRGDFVNVNGILVSYNGSDAEVNVPYGFTAIGSGAFLANDYIKYVDIPETVLYIDQMAFTDCSGLAGVFIPQSVQWIDDLAFAGCDNLVLYGVPESYAESYAMSCGISFSSEVHLLCNDQPVYYFEALPIIVYERTYVPLRAVLEKLGFSVYWDSEASCVYASSSEKEIIINRNGEIYVNGNILPTVSPPIYQNGRMMISVRILADGVGAEVSWDEVSRTVNIVTAD